MESYVQLLIPLEFPEGKISLPPENEEEVVAAVASLFLQILSAEERGEVSDELYS